MQLLRIKARTMAKKVRKYWKVRKMIQIRTKKQNEPTTAHGGLYGPSMARLLSHLNIFKNKKPIIYNI